MTIIILSTKTNKKIKRMMKENQKWTDLKRSIISDLKKRIVLTSLLMLVMLQQIQCVERTQRGNNSVSMQTRGSWKRRKGERMRLAS